MSQLFVTRFRIIAIYVILFWVILPLFLFGTGLRLDYLAPFPVVWARNLVILGRGLVGAGLVVLCLSIYQLGYWGRGLPISHLPPTNLVESGFYKIWRHPIYVGYTITLFGCAVLLNSFWTIIFSIPIFILGWLIYATLYEEPRLVSRFPVVYADYQRRVPLLIPKRLLHYKSPRIQWAQERLYNWLNALADWTVLYRKRDLIFVTFGIFIALGSFCFIMFTSSLFLAQGVDKQALNILIVSSILSIYVFGRIFWWVERWPQMIKQPWFGWRNIGFVSWGGYVGLAIAILLFCLFYGYSPLMITDTAVRGMFFAWGIGRIGCLTYGCCYGRSKEKPGIIYRNVDSKILREKGGDQPPRYPTPIYSSIKCFTLVIILNLIATLSLPVGFVTAMALMLYAAGRAIVEYFRERVVRLYGYYSCIVTFLIGWILLFFLVSPTINEFSPRPWSVALLIDTLPLLPIVLVMTFFIFLATSFHRKSIGLWL